VKTLFESWRQYLTEEEKSLDSYENLIGYLNQNPEANQNRNIDSPKGSTKAFKGGTQLELPFDYGEWTDAINPADNMGWDFVISPSSDSKSQNLKPVGIVKYVDGNGNDKVIIADNGAISEEDKKVISDFFNQLKDIFKDVEWF
tara:strand:- start:3488 stop:3919 length:432 start_codon:yes stop_codon:yes gene_type:complete